LIDFSPWASSATEAVKEMKFDTKVGWCWEWCWTSNTCILLHSAEKSRNTTLDNEKYVHYSRRREI